MSTFLFILHCKQCLTTDSKSGMSRFEAIVVHFISTILSIPLLQRRVTNFHGLIPSRRLWYIILEVATVQKAYLKCLPIKPNDSSDSRNSIGSSSASQIDTHLWLLGNILEIEATVPHKGNPEEGGFNSISPSVTEEFEQKTVFLNFTSLLIDASESSVCLCEEGC